MRPSADKTRLRFLLVTLAAVSLAGVIRLTGVHKKPLPLPEWTPTPVPSPTVTPSPTPVLPRVTPPKPAVTPHPMASKRFHRVRWLGIPIPERFGGVAVLCFWSDEHADALPYLNRLFRRYGNGAYWVGVPVGERVRLQQALYDNDVPWPQFGDLAANDEFRRARNVEPGQVLVLVDGEPRFSGRPDSSLERTLREQLGGERRTGEDPYPREVDIPLRFGGKKIESLGETRLRLFDDYSHESLTPETRFDAVTSTLHAPAIPPGSYVAQLLVAATSGRPADAFQRTFPIDVHDGPRQIPIFGYDTANERASVVNLWRFIRLREPFDNAWNAPTRETRFFYESPVTFVWDPVPDATSYSWGVFPSDTAWTGPTKSTRETRLTVPLAPGKAWTFYLTAHGASGLAVGRVYTVHEDLTDAEHFHFRTRSY